MAKAIQKRKNGEETKIRILKECLQLIAEQGPLSFTLDELSDRAGVAKTSILWHFGSKEDLILEAVGALFDDFEVRLKSFGIVDPTPDRLLAELFARVSEWFESAPELNAVFFQFMFQRGVHPDITARLREMYREFRRRLKEALHNPALTSKENEAVAIAVLALIDGVFVQFYLEPEAVSMKKTFATLTKMLAADRLKLGH